MIYMIRLIYLLLLALLVSVSAFGTTIKIATAYPDGTDVVKSLRALDTELRQQTDNRVKLKIYPAGVMGSDDAIRRKMMIGQLDATVSQSSAWTKEFPGLRVYGLPFFFDNFDQVLKARASFDTDILRLAEDSRFKAIGLIDGGMAYAMTQEPAVNLNQLQQQKLWLPADPALLYYASEFNLKAIDLNLSEITTSLQTGSIDGLIAPPAAAITLQWHHSLKYLTNVPVVYSFGVFVISKRSLEDLNEQDRSIMMNLTKLSLSTLDNTMVRQNSRALATLNKLGVTILEPADSEVQILKAQAKLIWKQVIEQGLIPEKLFSSLRTMTHND